jgi:hypothetical protein
MGFVSDALGGISDAVGSVTGSLFGNNDKKQSTKTTLPGMTQDEINARGYLTGALNKLYDQNEWLGTNLNPQDTEIENAFKTHLVNYLSGPQGQVTPDILKQSQDYVDQTFTNPAQSQFNQFQRGYEGSQAELAAQMGRSPLDSSIQQQNFRTLSDVASNLSAQRGQQIAQRADLLAYQRPMEQQQANAGLALPALSQGLQKSNYLSDLTQKAFQNRLNLLNLQSGNINNMTQQRIASAGTQQSGSNGSSGIFGGLSKIGQGLGGIASIGF